MVFYLNFWNLISWENEGEKEITRLQISQAIFCLSLTLSGGPVGTLGSLRVDNLFHTFAPALQPHREGTTAQERL